MKNIYIFTVITIAIFTIGCGASTVIVTPMPTNSANVNSYNPERDPSKDIQTAKKIAQGSGKNILIEVGGNWCIWCRRMENFFESNPELLNIRENHFILLKVNYSEENKNEAFLSNFPPIAGYPHIFILNSNGSLLHSQNTSELESDKSYNLEKFIAFLERWSK
jgi:thioredoxin-related protein